MIRAIAAYKHANTMIYTYIISLELPSTTKSGHAAKKIYNIANLRKQRLALKWLGTCPDRCTFLQRLGPSDRLQSLEKGNNLHRH